VEGSGRYNERVKNWRKHHGKTQKIGLKGLMPYGRNYGDATCEGENLKDCSETTSSLKREKDRKEEFCWVAIPR